VVLWRADSIPTTHYNTECNSHSVNVITIYPVHTVSYKSNQYQQLHNEHILLHKHPSTYIYSLKSVTARPKYFGNVYGKTLILSMLSAFDGSVLILFRRDMRYMICLMEITVNSASAQNKSGWHQVATECVLRVLSQLPKRSKYDAQQPSVQVLHTHTHTHTHTLDVSIQVRWTLGYIAQLQLLLHCTP